MAQCKTRSVVFQDRVILKTVGRSAARVVKSRRPVSELFRLFPAVFTYPSAATLSNQTTSETKKDLIVYLITLVATVAAANFAVVWFLAPIAKEKQVERQDKAVLVEFKRVAPGPVQPDPVVLLMGNSHTYAVPGMDPSASMQVDQEDIFIKGVEERFRQEPSHRKVQFHLIARPNFLPLEMLIRAERMYLDGEAPRVVILGLTWRNIARDSQVRSELQSLFRDPTFAEQVEESLHSLPNLASQDILAALDSEQRRARVKEERDRQKSDCDRFDEVLYDRIGPHLPLLGRGTDVRTQLYRLMFGLQDSWARRERSKYAYDLIETDYALNRDCLWALLELFHQHGAQVVCYLAPERHDLQPLVDPAQEVPFDEMLRAHLAAIDGLLLDARQIVPDEWWGWENGTPDRSHFSTSGHALMAEFLFRELSQRGVWRRFNER
jgi:hypothetical protein